MERVRKTFFDPLARSKSRISEILRELPAGSAHPFNPERVLLCRTESGIEEIDISDKPEEYFYNAVDLGDMGETLLRRMAGFRSHLSVFDDFQIMQAPAASFRIPIVADQITILAVSERTPTYYDFCFADAECNACCWIARETFGGITHSGDLTNSIDLLDYVRINDTYLTDNPICVFISGYQKTNITRFLGTNPALLVADHVEKILYIIPVPLDEATIGDATICCPLVIKGDRDSLICSIIPTATTDRGMMCHSEKLLSPCFPEAIRRADFNVATPKLAAPAVTKLDAVQETDLSSESQREIMAKRNALFTTNPSALPSFLKSKDTQVIRFGTGINFMFSDQDLNEATEQSAVVLPCIFGSRLQGPILLATGSVPSAVPFYDEIALREYYEQLSNVVVVVDDRMTDNARNLATGLRINALFIVQLNPREEPETTDQLLFLLSSANINAVTALAGPQSLILVQVFEKFYFYRGLANPRHLKTTHLAFGADVTSVIKSTCMDSLLNPKIQRFVNLEDDNTILFPSTEQFVRPQDLQRLFEQLPFDKINDMREDVLAAVPQLQALLNQKDLQQLSKDLVSTLSEMVSKATSPLRNAYIQFIAREFNIDDPESAKKKGNMLGELRKVTKETQSLLEPVISSLANIMSSQTTSKRTHDLKRLVRQAQIKNNVEATKSMTFDTLTGYLETYAGEMGVMLLNIETAPYQQILGSLKNAPIDANPCCELDSRVLHLDGFDAGIIIQQSQIQHHGPLQSQVGPSHPILALPYLSQGRGTGSMLAWVCWDEFVNLDSPYSVRWMDKCNEPHIAALRIVMRDTLSRAVASREHNIQAGSPEAGHLMSALLMAAMKKLAAMRTTAPVVLDKAEDTVTRLMRGLFGNLMTIAGSGVRPLSMVWQLFGLNPQYDLPTTDNGWVWYETVVQLYPYTGWPIDQFHKNLAKLVDKAIIRVATKNENVAEIKMSRVAEMIRYCKLRNIQLDHSRTLVTTFMRMLTTENVDVPAVGGRLLEQLPRQLQKQTMGYTRMIKYVNHLAKGGQRRMHDDLVTANVYTKRSAAFKELKTKVAEACEEGEWSEAKACCQAMLEKHKEIAAMWHVEPQDLKIQNLKTYRELIDADFEETADQETKSNNRKLVQRVCNDAEKRRVPWHVGSKDVPGEIEPLDESFVHEILTGESPEPPKTVQAPEEQSTVTATPIEQGDFSQFKSTLSPGFVATMQKALSAEDVCRILKIPVSTMRVFIKALNPSFAWEDLGERFKAVILGLLQERSNRAESDPVYELLGIQSVKNSLQIGG
ncbi:hypothetical protein FZEAL_2172 [Fusarium zealandicum]|uniref:Uncharacterized protein n=1 Tax=Fusarium zealandicum TaxID=1053134 RepID=A0A8H4XP62_9HYPO|nr:hypothetical protein FZEAL_2172 [Fusarium zealandicum]